ncbi:CBS domain-containing protein [Synechococcus sp. PCC 7336]|uniref:CBS domain-containing protein n=1 Tax=Synechococcus sp. PCC 7336 TaxID=195250 RepID=UPI00034B7B08|nr:CBS domain-containing protein [Synechococcus sp. PCC 7336]
MDIILCHETADFDALGAAVGAARLYPGARIVLTGGAHQSVREFLGLYRDEYPLLELRSVDERSLHRIVLVDVQAPRRLGKAAEWLYRPEIEVHVYDHHPNPTPADYRPALWCVEPVGSTSTLIVERLQEKGIDLSPFEVTALALGIHVDTGSLTFGSSTARDAKALTWLMERGVNLDVLATYIDRGLTPQMQDLLARGLDELGEVAREQAGYRLAVWTVRSATYLRGLAGIVEQLIDLTDVDVLVAIAKQDHRISIIGRSQQDFAQLQEVMQRYGGGGHPRAASASLSTKHEDRDIEQIAEEIRSALRDRVPQPVRAADIMSSPVRTIRPETTIDEAQRLLLRYGHSGLSVMNRHNQLVGVISRRDLDLALHHGFGHAPVRGYMTTPVRTIAPDTSLNEIQDLMLKWDIGRLPVLDRGELAGIVTRTDVLRQLHDLSPATPLQLEVRDRLQVRLKKMLPPRYRDILQQAAIEADRLQLHLYLVGGTVRDLLLDRPTDDLDLVVDGRHPIATEGKEPEGWGVKLARSLQFHYPDAKLEIHGKFQTAALTWPDGLWLDIATARTEFYPYPAAAPEVAASSIQQDLYRRDFSINALALRLNGPPAGEILDFFGGLDDLEHHQIRVLHPNSFIEDPTRTIRAVRFAVRLGFSLDDRTRDYAIAASHLAHGQQFPTPALEQGARLKQELGYVLCSDRWPEALQLLNDLGALRYLHPDLHLSSQILPQMRRVGAWAYHFSARHPDLHRRTLWQLRLECLLAHCPQAAEIAQSLNWPKEGLERLQQFPVWRDCLLPQLAGDLLPSQVVAHLNPLRTADVVLLAGEASPHCRRYLWQYLSVWQFIKAPLDGHALKQMGYRVGPQFKAILQAMRSATLDGAICDTDGAIAFLQTHFPLKSAQP